MAGAKLQATPEGWTATWSDEEQAYFYTFNGVSLWRPPTFAPPKIPDGWSATWDEGEQKYYYTHLESGIPIWDPPKEAPHTSYEPGAGWTAIWDAQHGKYY